MVLALVEDPRKKSLTVSVYCENVGSRRKFNPQTTMKPKLYTVTGTAEINGETLEVWADVGPRGAIKEVRSYRTQTLNDGEQVHHNDIFKKSEWSGFQLADLDPSRVGDNDKLPENLKELLS